MLLELPDYRMPHLRSVCIDVWGKIRDYLTRAATVVLLASILLWWLSHMGRFGFTTDISQSFAATLGKALVPILRPAGLGFWQIAVALIAGIWAKEIVVSATYTIFGTALIPALQEIGFGTPNAACLMLFCLLYVPCTATLAAIRRESHSTGIMLRSLLMHLFTAYTVSFLFYQVTLFFQR